MLVRPGALTANPVMLREAQKPGTPPLVLGHYWVQRVTYEDFSDADTSQVLTLNTAFPRNAFPADVFLLFGPWAYFDLVEGFDAPSLTDADAILGVTGNTNGLVEVQALEDGQTLGRKFAPGDLYTLALLDQTAMSPLFQLDLTGANLNTMTAGIVDIYIPYTLMPSRRSA